MKKEKIEITQDLCMHVKALLDGGLTQKQAAKFVKVSPATVSRISAAGFSAVAYNHNNEVRRAEEKKKAMDQLIPDEPETEEQVPGQISMDLLPAEEEKPEMSEQTKMMRFLAGKFKDTDDVIQITIGELILQVGKIYDMLGMIMRRIDK